MTRLSGFSLYFGKRIKGMWNFSRIAANGECQLGNIPNINLPKHSPVSDIQLDFRGMKESEIRHIIRKAIRFGTIEHPVILEQIYKGLESIIKGEERILSYHYQTELGALRSMVRLEETASFCDRWNITTEKTRCEQLIIKARKLLDSKEAIYRKRASISPSLVLTRHLFPNENVRFIPENGTLLTPEEVMWLFYTPECGLQSLEKSYYPTKRIDENIAKSAYSFRASRSFPLQVWIKRDKKEPFRFNIEWNQGTDKTYLDDQAWTASRRK